MGPIEEWPGSAARWAEAKCWLGGGVATGLRAAMPPHPLYFVRGDGARLFDVDGHCYLDYVLGWGPVILGHAHPRLVEAVTAQLGRGQTFGACHELEYSVAERVCAVVPGAQRVLWSNTGTEATQTALRLARAITGRNRLLRFGGAYHGWSDTFLVGYRDQPGDRPRRGHHPRAAEDVEVVAWNDLERVCAVLTDQRSDIAAVIAEPVLCNTGVLAPGEGFLAGLREVCDQTGTVLVFDEVITGFRMAYGGAAERYAVTPDLTVLGKAIGGGFPLAAVAGRADLIDQVTAGVTHAGTFNGNPTSLAAADATLGALKAAGAYGTFEELAARLASGLAAQLTDQGIRGSVHHIGPVVQCALGVDRVLDVDAYLAADWETYDRLLTELLRRGVFTLPGGRWYLSTAHTSRDIDETIVAFGAALEAVRGSGSRPSPSYGGVG